MQRNAMPCGRKKTNFPNHKGCMTGTKLFVTSAVQLQGRQKSSSASVLMLVMDAAKWTVVHVYILVKLS